MIPPALYDIEETDEILVQGERETDPEHLTQLLDDRKSETFVRVPRSLLTRYAPRSEAPVLQPFASISHLFREFRHTAWRLETRRGYASDRNSPKWSRFLNGEDIATEPENAWRENVRAQTAQGKKFERVRLVDEPLTQGQPVHPATLPQARTSQSDPLAGEGTAAAGPRLLALRLQGPRPLRVRRGRRDAGCVRHRGSGRSPPRLPGAGRRLASRRTYRRIRQADTFHDVSTDYQTAGAALGAHLRELRAA